MDINTYKIGKVYPRNPEIMKKHDRLATKLGREPTSHEACAEVKRILQEASIAKKARK